MYYPNYTEFYQKALIPIGVNDHSSLLKWSNDDTEVSHWLIALEGHPKDKSEYYTWKVIVFATDRNGNFRGRKPCYTSIMFECFHKAYDAVKEIETQGRSDVLYSSNFQERIS
ncbi:hypothetical protein ACFYKX_23675 [Cytobacillus sp. FJAT-54145]|uniref:Uncharacterized protein n=1 Tax=Cytobacillus spartinae TaxID=3299023 RepID=A0ABW6KIL7_9BACI